MQDLFDVAVSQVRAYRDTVVQTHWVSYPSDENGRQARAVCGAWVEPKHVSADPTCPECKATVEDDADVDPEALLNAPYVCVVCGRELRLALMKRSPHGRLICQNCVQTPRGREEWRR